MSSSPIQISKRIDYALRAMLYLSKQPPGQLTSFRVIAERQVIPSDFLAKILKDLVKNGLVKVKRGSKGGYTLGKDPSDITFLDIIEAVDGPIKMKDCLDESIDCSILDMCSLIQVWKEAQNRLIEIFSNVTMRDLVECEARKAKELFRTQKSQ